MNSPRMNWVCRSLRMDEAMARGGELRAGELNGHQNDREDQDRQCEGRCDDGAGDTMCTLNPVAEEWPTRSLIELEQQRREAHGQDQTRHRSYPARAMDEASQTSNGVAKSLVVSERVR